MNQQLYSQVAQLGHAWLVTLFKRLLERYRGLDQIADTSPLDEQLFQLAKALHITTTPEYLNVATVETLILEHCELLRVTIKGWQPEKIGCMDFLQLTSFEEMEARYMQHEFNLLLLSQSLTQQRIKSFVYSIITPMSSAHDRTDNC